MVANELEDKAQTRYLIFTYFEHISADYLQEMVMDALESSNILIDRLANLSTEGPKIDTKSASKAKSKT